MRQDHSHWSTSVGVFSVKDSGSRPIEERTDRVRRNWMLLKNSRRNSEPQINLALTIE